LTTPTHRKYNTGSGTVAWWITQLGLGSAGEYEINNTSNSSNALLVTTNGTGNAGKFVSNTGDAVQGVSSNGGGGHFVSLTNADGVNSSSSGGYAVHGISGAPASISDSHAFGVYGTSSNGRGVGGYSDNDIGVIGESTNSIGVYGFGGTWAGFFNGNVNVTGTLSANTITATIKNFKIDHPLDPANKYLLHASVESSEMENIYSGNVRLDAHGKATVQMPRWFQALNADFRYQLTCVGGFSPVYIAREIQGNRFEIAGGKAGIKVSWQITGVRHDAYAKANPLQVEQDKSASERGTYLYPAGQGKKQKIALGSQR
jgi:hypothetical protein